MDVVPLCNDMHSSINVHGFDMMIKSEAYVKFREKLSEWRKRHNRQHVGEDSDLEASVSPFAFLETFAQEVCMELNERSVTYYGFRVTKADHERKLSSNIFLMLGEDKPSHHDLKLHHLVVLDPARPRHNFCFSLTNWLGDERDQLTARDVQCFLYALRNVIAHQNVQSTLTAGCFPHGTRVRVRAALEQQFLFPVTLPAWPAEQPQTKNPCKFWAADRDVVPTELHGGPPESRSAHSAHSRLSCAPGYIHR